MLHLSAHHCAVLTADRDDSVDVAPERGRVHVRVQHWCVVRGLLLVVAICVALVPGRAEARRTATPAEARAVQAGVRTYAATSGCCISAGVRFVGTWISTVDRDFGVAKIVSLGTDGSPGPRATAVLVHTHSGRWTVIALGTARLACGVAPQIRRDLRLPSCRSG